VLRAAEKTETTQENIQDWLQSGKEDPEFQLLTEQKISAVIFIIYFNEPHLNYCTMFGHCWAPNVTC
jgi:hypothetical protein